MESAVAGTDISTDTTAYQGWSTDFSVIISSGLHIPTDGDTAIVESAVDPVATDSIINPIVFQGSSTDLAASLSGGCDWSGDGGAGRTPNSYSNPNRNSSGFSVLPVGRQFMDLFFYAGNEAIFWSATSAEGSNAYSRLFSFCNAGVLRSSENKGFGFSVRCLRDVSGVTFGAVTKTDSTSSTLSISAAHTTTKTVTSASICAYTDAECTTAAGICAADVAYSTSPITGTITGLNANTQYYVKVTATTAGGTASTRAGLFGTAAMDTISFVANGGTGTMTEQVVNRGTAVAIPTNAFTHDGNWNFTWWDDACDGNGTHYADGANITTSGNVTLYAQWHTFCTGTPTNCELGSARIDSVKDHQDNWYKVVQIGNQCWLKENMRCTTSPKGILALGSEMDHYNPKYYDYTDTTQFSLRERGYLYNWIGAIDTIYTT